MLNCSIDKVKQLIELLQDKEVQSFLNLFIDNSIVTSDLNILKRLSAVEKALGLNCYSEEEEEHEPTIPEQITTLTEKIESISEPIKPNIENSDIPTSKTEKRACELVQHLKDTGKDHLTSHEIIHFLKCKLPDYCKIDDNIQNIRKVKQDVLSKATSMYPNVFLSKKKTGHREVRLILSS